MGQTYSVELNLQIKDKNEFVKLGNEFLNKTEAEFNKFQGFDEVDSIVGTVLAFHQGQFKRILSKVYRLYWSSFDASYSWETVLDSFWMAIAPSLKLGSYIRVWPDEGEWSHRR